MALRVISCYSDSANMNLDGSERTNVRFYRYLWTFTNYLSALVLFFVMYVCINEDMLLMDYLSPEDPVAFCRFHTNGLIMWRKDTVDFRFNLATQFGQTAWQFFSVTKQRILPLTVDLQFYLFNIAFIAVRKSKLE